MKRMQTDPPVDFIAAAWLKAQMPKPFAGDEAYSAGLPVKRGKVKRGDIRR